MIVYRLQQLNFLYWQSVGDFQTEKEAKEMQRKKDLSEARSRILKLKYD